MAVNFFAGKNILVTGGTGFVGSHLVEELVRQKASVVTTFISTSPKSYFFSQGLHKRVSMVHVDVRDFDGIFDVVTKFKIEYIFHLAAESLVETAFYNPKRTIETNVIGTTNVLESVRLFPHAKGVIVASSDKAYGKMSVAKSLPRHNKYIETDPLRGDHPYEVSKSAGDLICSSYFKTYGAPVVITRFGNIYGEGDLNFSRIIPGAIQSLLRNEVLQIRSDGTYVRDYLYVKDVVEGYMLLAKSINKIKGEAFNFGSSETLSVIEVIKAVQKYAKKKISYKILNTARNEIPYQSLDFSKIRKTFGWKPRYRLQTTIKKITKWYRKILS
ncbi:GDP-mannose 4,6-dehydratase [Candidatus Roizmanbacteria bacterium]|nr:GDP-mannose 4,6-dehydratase [Candidatus Roizmanbacteria bacterium]